MAKNPHFGQSFFYSFLMGLGLLCASPFASANEVSGLPIIPFNKKEYREVLDRYRSPAKPPTDQQPQISSGELCQLIQADCLILAYVGETPFNGNGQILTPLLKRTGSGSESWNYFASLLKYDGYGSVSALVRRDKRMIGIAFEKFVNGQMKVAEFEEFVLKHSRGLSALSQLYKEYRLQNLPTLNTDSLSQTSNYKRIARNLENIENILFRSSLLMLELLGKQTPYPSPAYQFRDGLVSQNQILDITQLYKELTQLKLWPIVKSLTPQVRARSPLAFRQINSRGQWKVKGTYDVFYNQLWIDFEQDFFENLYVLQHELWHVAWRNSNLGNHDTKVLETLLNQSDVSLLAEALTGIISRNELLALDQQIRLFHAGAAITEQLKNAESAKGWHDSYYGKGIYKYFQSKFKSWVVETYKNADEVIVSPLDGLVKAILKKIAKSQDIDLQNPMSKLSIPESYFEAQVGSHKTKFEERYLKGHDTKLSPKKLVQESDLSKMKIQMPIYAQVDCNDLKRAYKILGPQWDYGLPFLFQVQDLESPVCDEIRHRLPKGVLPGTDGSHPGTDGSHPGTDGSHPGTDGSHPGTDGSHPGTDGSHPGTDGSHPAHGFPSLDGKDD